MDNDGAKLSEIKLVRVSEGTFRARFFRRNSGFDLVCLLVYGIPTRSILKVLSYGMPGGSTYGSSFVQNPLVFLEIRFLPMCTISGLEPLRNFYDLT